MSWFKRAKPPTNHEDERLRRADNDAIEIVAHKNATKDLIKEAKAANHQLQDLLAKNGFTVKIYIAAGGKTKTHKIRKTI